ncbi:protein FAM53A-like isoform X2 [Scleropages formosus]|uniref:protein FAM53A-like isoform X2 n=1 Tax=Scleropages formosus TaxID=113540 RepID=UPI0010FA6BC5|nr:protein FAM53A isoform X2 [Scleropages formosus]
MMALITQKLQEQSLSDRSCKAFHISLHAGNLHPKVALYPYAVREEKLWGLTSQGCALQIDSVTGTPKGPLTCPLGAAGMGLDLPRHQSEPGFRTTTFPSSPSSGCEPDGPSTLPGHISKLTLNENSGSPLAPPTKRHCRSLSEPGGLSRCRSPWKPGSGSKIWTPISKQRCSSGGVVSLHCGNSLGGGGSSFHQPASPSCGRGHLLATGRGTPGVAMSPVPRPASASSGFVGSGGQSSGPSSPSSSCCSSLAVPRHSAGSRSAFPGRRLSLSQEHIPDSASSTPLSTPELGRRLGLPRCRSQPCVLQDRKGGLKRRREDEVRWSRPSLDFLKMTQTLMNTRGLRFLGDEELHTRTVVSSSPASGTETTPSRRGFDPEEVPVGDGDTSDCESAEDAAFPLDCGDLDLEQIENN